MILVVDMNARDAQLHVREFVWPIVSLLDGVESYSVMNIGDVKDARLDIYTKIILSGVPLRYFGFQEHDISWIFDFEKPVLGICAGMQAMAKAYGGELSNCQEIGMVEIKTFRENPLFNGEFKAYCLHTMGVTESDEYEVLAQSTGCIQAIKHKLRDHYGVMFHPEVRNREIIENFARS